MLLTMMSHMAIMVPRCIIIIILIIIDAVQYHAVHDGLSDVNAAHAAD